MVLVWNRQVQIETLSLDDKAQHPSEWCLFATDCAVPLPQTVAAKLLTFGRVKGGALPCGEEGERLGPGAPVQPRIGDTNMMDPSQP